MYLQSSCSQSPLYDIFCARNVASSSYQVSGWGMDGEVFLPVLKARPWLSMGQTKSGERGVH